ncbi:hypothetical protein [Alkalicoccus halolimnae]|uniref:Uncharacterized protein n=1 Tax=Alkalicoccus halolimnae TaxID=1667239 RepID=A0A5C7FG61_9BACI|nr:hypothetical protein [Alkalicoccus halolimnae]TXF83576.1 hypothetical protein FTX54_12150 [Alkalicoccus halolimnae]
MHSAKRFPPAGKLLFVLHLLLALGALFGGGGLVIDPSGDLLMLPLSLLDQTPFASYLVPGVILLLLFGLVPLVIMWGFLRHPSWKAAEAVNLFKRHHWSWSFSLYTGYALVIWIIVQTYLFQEVLLIHLISAGLGLLIQAVTLLPKVQAWAEEIKRT